MTILRLACGAALLLAAVAAIVSPDLTVLVAAIAAGFVVRVLFWRSARYAFRSALPVLIFAGGLAALEWISQGGMSPLGLKAVAVFLLSTAAIRVLPWSEVISTASAGSKSSHLVLFGLFVGHFAGIFSAEAARVLQARALCLARPWGPGWFRSLGAAVATVFSRSLARAERFYAAQFLRGLAE